MGGTFSSSSNNNEVKPQIKKWRNGVTREEIHSNGLRRSYYENGIKESETYVDGTYWEWYPNGSLKKEGYKSGEIKEYNRSGTLIFHKLSKCFFTSSIPTSLYSILSGAYFPFNL